MIFCYINKPPPSSAPFLKAHFICSQFCRSGIWPGLSGAVLLLYVVSAGVFHEVEIRQQLGLEYQHGFAHTCGTLAGLAERPGPVSASPLGFFTWQLDSKNEYSKWWSRSSDLLRPSLGRYTPPLTIVFWWKQVPERTQIWREEKETPLLAGRVERFFANEHKGWETLLQPSFETQSPLPPKAPLPGPTFCSAMSCVYLAQASCTAVRIPAFFVHFIVELENMGVLTPDTSLKGRLSKRLELYFS